MKFSRKQKAERHQRFPDHYTPRRSRGQRQVDPSDMELFCDQLQPRKPDYKTLALCKQVSRVLSTALAGSCGDPVLQELCVVEVTPAPHAGRLQVLVMGGALVAAMPAVDVYARLAEVMGLLRAEVAAGICRKRAPELAIVLISKSQVQP